MQKKFLGEENGQFKFFEAISNITMLHFVFTLHYFLASCI